MMIDYGFKFTNVAQAIADATMLAGQYDLTSGWLPNHVLAGLQVWRPSQDVAGTDEQGNPTVTHTYLSGFYVLVSVDTSSPISALINHPNLAFALNRTAREAGQAFVIKNNIGAVLADLGVSPMFLSSNPYPIGGYS